MAFVKIATSENDDLMELPTEEDNTILLSTLTTYFPGACSLKYKSVSGTTRGIRNAGGRLHPPSPEGWGNETYYCVFQNVPDPFLRPSSSEMSASTISSISSDSFNEKSKHRSAQMDLSTKSHTFLERMKVNKDLTNLTASSTAFNSTLRRINVSKTSSLSMDSSYNAKMKKIQETLVELKKAYKQKLINDFIMKAYNDLVFDKNSGLPESIAEDCRRNILKGRLGFFHHSKELCNSKLYEAIFAEPIHNNVEPLNIKDSKILQEKLFQLVLDRAQDAVNSIVAVKECGFASFLTPSLVKPGSIFTDEQLTIISQCRKIKSAHDKCKATAHHITEMLQRLSDLRTTTLPRLNNDAVDCLTAQAEIVKKETRCFSTEVEEKIKEGDENVVEALQVLRSTLKDAVQQKTYKLAKLRKQKEEYDLVKGPKFSEMINEYKQLMLLYNSKKELLDGLMDSPSCKSHISSSDGSSL
ncbi:unnamed protein product [Bemisia tabaci]|uniref:TAR DNA-binding protein 43 N-terminal domain-containing protein n=1 Tax=Bemisia tabaci TaxID=7038 RepID=A0A9P0F572_BEMTA|nr:unnamed protein product [Bemisia tabaci]